MGWLFFTAEKGVAMTYQSHQTVSAFLAGLFGITILCVLAYTPSSGHGSYAPANQHSQPPLGVSASWSLDDPNVAVGTYLPISPRPPMACSRIAFDSTRDGNYEIYVMNADGTNQTRLTNNSAIDARASISADGNRIAFGSNRDGNYEIYVMNADGSGQIRLTNNLADDFIPNFSPDGSKIAFESVRDGNFEVYVMNADGTNQTRLTNNLTRDGNPAFSPDGSKIAFESSREGNSEIYVMNADGSGQTRLTNNPAEDGDPFFSPDSSRIAFETNRDGDFWEIYVMNVDGSGLTRLTNNTAHDTDPFFSPDGSKIAFENNRDGGFYEIYVMNADGTGQTNLSNSPENDFSPSWSGCQASPTPTPTPSCVHASNDRLSWWSGDGNANDIQDGNNGTLQNGTSFAPGMVNQAFSFTGSGEVLVPDSANLNFGQNDPITVEAWVFRRGTSPVMHILGKRVGCGAAGIHYQLAFDGNGLRFDGDSGGSCGNNGACSGINPPINEWMHVAGTYDGTTFKIYVNGQLAGNGSGTLGSANTEPLLIGLSGTCDSSTRWEGLIDEVTIYRRALSALEIQDIFNAGSAGKCKAQSTPTPIPTPTPSPAPTPTGTVTHSYISSGSQSCKSVAVIDTSTHTEVARIPMENEEQGTGGTPTELAITPDGRFVYVLRGADVGVVDTTTNVEVAAIPTPDGCGYDNVSSHIVMSPDGTRVYATSNGRGCESLAVIDASTHTEVARIPMENEAEGTGGTPTELAITPDGRFVYVLRGADVGVVDTTTNVEVAAIPTPDSCGYDNVSSHIVMSSDGTRVYATSNGRGCESLAVIDISTNTEVARIPMENEEQGTGGPPTELAITPDGRFVYVLRGADVSVVDTATNVEIAAIPTPDGCGYDNVRSHIVMSPAGPVFSDADGDGVADSIDTGDGTFSDGTTSGMVVDAHGLQVRIEDVPSPSGVKIRIGPGLGQATFSLCASGYELQIAPESEVVVTCGSITVKVVAGAARVRLSGDSAFVFVPQTTTVTIVNNSEGTYLVTNTADSSAAVDVTVDGVHTTILPGQQFLVSRDLTPPVIACPTNISVAGDIPGSCSAMVNPGVASATDNSSTVTVAGVRSDGQLLNAPYSLGTTTITWTATDAAGNQSSCQQLITVNNPNPVVIITGPPSGAIYAVGTSVNFSGTFTDNAGGTHSATWIFDNVTQSASVAEPYGSIPGSVNTTFTFTNSGVYLIRLVVDDGCGGTGVAETVDGLTAMIVVYDPNGGYVTGGGWINSPVGAYQPDQSITGKANFGFVSKYQHGATVPTGQTEFQFKVANLNFHSIAYEWLVVGGARAQFKGIGTINGSGNYGFLLTAIDGSVSGGGGIDRFRIKIWDKENNNAIVYDNKLGSSDNSNSATDLGGGGIIIHQ
jgi:Concanavalin A-like lectin/glucanases superfamily/WD40-like Beta Propeller Repeat/HYR domain